MSRKVFIIILLVLGMSMGHTASYSTYNLTSCIFNSNFSNLMGWEPVCTPGQTSAIITTLGNATGVFLRAEPNVTVGAAVQIWPSTVTTYYYSGSTVTTYCYSQSTIPFQPITLVDESNVSTGPIQYQTDAIMFKIRLRGVTNQTVSTYSSGLIPGMFTVVIENSLNHKPYSTMVRPALYNIGGLITSGPNYTSMPDWNEMTFTLIPENPCDWWQIRNLQFTYTPYGVNYVSGIMIDRVEIFGIGVDPD